MITRVRMKNWRSHIDSDLQFGRGVNALVGIMGSGKSSVVQAISFGLFGTFPQLQSKRMKLDDLIMRKPSRKQRTEVEVEFQAGGNAYSVKRLVEEGRGTVLAEFRENGVLLDVNPRSVNDLVERKLQMDYDLFSRAVYSEQNGLDSFLRVQKGHRMEQVDRMLKVDRFERARESAVALSNRVKNGLAEKMRIVSDMEKEGLDARIKGLSGEISSLLETLERLRSDYSAISKEKVETAGMLSEAESKDSDLQSIRRELEGLRAAFREVSFSAEQKRERVGGEDLGALRKKHERLGELLKELDNDLVIKKEEERTRRELLAGINARMQVASRKELPALGEKLSTMEGQWLMFNKMKQALGGINIVDEELKLEAARKGLYSLLARKEELERHMKDLTGKTRCPVCQTEVGKERKEVVLGRKKRELKRTGKLVAQRSEEVKQLEKDFDYLQRETKEFYILEERIKDYHLLKAEHGQVAEAIGMLGKDAEEMAEKLQVAVTEANDLGARQKAAYIEHERLGQMIRDSLQLRELEQKRVDYFRKIKAAEEREAGLASALASVDMQSLRKELQEKVAQEREMKARRTSFEDKAEDKKNALADLAGRLGRMNSYKEEIRTDEMVIEKLGGFVRVLKATQDQLREEFLKSVNYIMDRLWQELYPYGDYQGVRLAIDDDYILQLKGSDGWTSADLISGGERSMACLALRIAFSLAFMPNLKWLILDEPTHNLDSNAIRQLSEILKEKINAYVDQVFLITHEDRICEGLTGAIYRLDRNKDLNEPTQIAGM
ncbi:MAG: SMC family ATPase [Candidatus Aenigmarchaeota archaeon]|nr:SMC family ATPase [Candidatus Aenigmarchaeota archaeon]